MTISGFWKFPSKSKKSIVFLFLLVVLSIIGNFFSMPLFYGVDLLFGSIALLIILALYGFGWALIIAAFVGILSGIVFDDAFLFIVFLCEILYVGTYLRYRNSNLLFADGMFWLFISLPLSYMFYISVAELGFDKALLITLKFSVNGIFNAVVASLVVNHTPIRKWLTGAHRNTTIPLQYPIFNLLMACVFFPALIFLVVDNYRDQMSIEAQAESLIEFESKEIVGQVLNWREERYHALNELAQVAAQSDLSENNISYKELQASTDHIRASYPDFLRMHVDNKEGKSVTFSPLYDENGILSSGLSFADRTYYNQMKNTGAPYMSDVFMGRVGDPVPIIILGVPIPSKDSFEGYVIGSLDLSYFSKMLAINVDTRKMQATIIDRKGFVIASTRNDLYHLERYKPINESGDSCNLSGWNKSSFKKIAHIDNNIPWQVVTEIPIQPYVKGLIKNNIKDLALLLVFSVIGFLFSILLSRYVVSPLTNLALLTTNLPRKLANHRDLKWPVSGLRELDSLIDNFRQMAATLQRNFKDIELAKVIAEEERNKLRAILAGIGDGISIQDKNYKIIYQNDVQKRMMGEYIGEYCYKAYGKRETICPECPVAASFNDGKVHIAELDRTVKDAQLNVEVTSSPLKDASGNIISAIEVIRDITSRKQAEEALRESEHRYRDLFENASDLIQSVNIDSGKFIYVNRVWYETLGYTEEDLKNLVVFDLIHPDYREKGQEYLAQLKNGEDITNLKIVFLAKNGEAVYLEGSSTCRIKNGKPVATRGILRNVTGRKKAEELMLQQSAAMQTSIDGITILDQDGCIVYMNEANAKIYGYDTPEELIGKSWEVCYDQREIQLIKTEVLPVLKAKGHYRAETWGRKKDNSKFPQELSISLIGNGGIVCVCRDITGRKEAERIIWEEKERAQVTLHSIGDAVITTDARGNIEFLNSVAEEMTGWDNDEAFGLPLNEVFNVINAETGEEVENPVEKCLEEGKTVGLSNNIVLIHRSGHQFAIENSAAPIKNWQGEIIGVVLVFHDVTEKRSIIEQLIYQSYHDPLTDLPNRILFNERLQAALTQAQINQKQLAVLFLDLDEFKLVNDLMGHDMGDRLIYQVAKRIAGCVGEGNTVARLGGDEFIILLPEIGEVETAARLAQKILTEFRQPWIIGDNEFHVTASMGISIYPNDGTEPETLMRHADTAMYRAKDQGRNNYQLFAASMNSRIRERIALERSLRQAVDKKQFKVFYQPQVDIQTGQITGMEALVRWIHPEKGIVSPAEFIPAAEDTGLIIPIGEMVLKEACLQNKAWQDAGYPPMKVTVNFSARQFQQKDLLQMISRILDETGLDPKWLEVEITESILMQDVENKIDMLRSIREHGITIAIDDFGTGYSSLNYLKRLPVDTLKIDRTFVQDVNRSEADAAIVMSVIVLAKNLKLKLIAEGIETEEQLNFFKEKKCCTMQGYLFSKPVSAEEFVNMLKK